MLSEERLLANWSLQKYLNDFISTQLINNHILFGEPVYENINDKLWLVYFTSHPKDVSPEKVAMKTYYQTVTGFAFIDVYYSNIGVIDSDKDYSLQELLVRFRNHLRRLMRDCEEVL